MRCRILGIYFVYCLLVLIQSSKGVKTLIYGPFPFLDLPKRYTGKGRPADAGYGAAPGDENTSSMRRSFRTLGIAVLFCTAGFTKKTQQSFGVLGECRAQVAWGQNMLHASIPSVQQSSCLV